MHEDLIAKKLTAEQVMKTESCFSKTYLYSYIVTNRKRHIEYPGFDFHNLYTHIGCGNGIKTGEFSSIYSNRFLSWE